MNKFWIAMSPVLFAIGCVPVDKGTDSGDSGEVDTDTDTDIVDDTPEASASWGADAVTISVNGGPGGYWLGMAQSGTSDNWTGEDCVWGYELSSGEVIGPYCHNLGDGGDTVLTYGGSTSDLQAGTTVFTDETAGSGGMTYYLESDPDYGGSGECWVWGDDASYYDGLSCSEL